MTTTFTGASGQPHQQISSDPFAVLRSGLRVELGTPLVNEVNTWLAGNSPGVTASSAGPVALTDIPMRRAYGVSRSPMGKSDDIDVHDAYVCPTANGMLTAAAH